MISGHRTEKSLSMGFEILELVGILQTEESGFLVFCSGSGDFIF